jgi:4-hydroxy-3-polyprenylbenzoate decarboxylase
MSFKNLQEFVGKLENEQELVRIRTYVNPYLEMAEITDRISKSPHGGKALLFENTGLWQRKSNVHSAGSTSAK